MAEGMPKPSMTTVPDAYRKLKNRGRQVDEQIEESETGQKPESAKQEKKESVGMPKPSLLTRALRAVTGK